MKAHGADSSQHLREPIAITLDALNRGREVGACAAYSAYSASAGLTDAARQAGTIAAARATAASGNETAFGAVAPPEKGIEEPAHL